MPVSPHLLSEDDSVAAQDINDSSRSSDTVGVGGRGGGGGGGVGGIGGSDEATAKLTQLMDVLSRRFEEYLRQGGAAGSSSSPVKPPRYMADRAGEEEEEEVDGGPTQPTAAATLSSSSSPLESYMLPRPPREAAPRPVGIINRTGGGGGGGQKDKRPGSGSGIAAYSASFVVEADFQDNNNRSKHDNNSNSNNASGVLLSADQPGGGGSHHHHTNSDSAAHTRGTPPSLFLREKAPSYWREREIFSAAEDICCALNGGVNYRLLCQKQQATIELMLSMVREDVKLCSALYAATAAPQETGSGGAGGDSNNNMRGAAAMATNVDALLQELRSLILESKELLRQNGIDLPPTFAANILNRCGEGGEEDAATTGSNNNNNKSNEGRRRQQQQQLQVHLRDINGYGDAASPLGHNAAAAAGGGGGRAAGTPSSVSILVSPEMGSYGGGGGGGGDSHAATATAAALVGWNTATTTTDMSDDAARRSRYTPLSDSSLNPSAAKRPPPPPPPPPPPQLPSVGGDSAMMFPSQPPHQHNGGIMMASTSASSPHNHHSPQLLQQGGSAGAANNGNSTSGFIANSTSSNVPQPPATGPGGALLRRLEIEMRQSATSIADTPNPTTMTSPPAPMGISFLQDENNTNNNNNNTAEQSSFLQSTGAGPGPEAAREGSPAVVFADDPALVGAAHDKGRQTPSLCSSRSTAASQWPLEADARRLARLREVYSEAYRGAGMEMLLDALSVVFRQQYDQSASAESRPEQTFHDFNSDVARRVLPVFENYAAFRAATTGRAPTLRSVYLKSCLVLHVRPSERVLEALTPSPAAATAAEDRDVTTLSLSGAGLGDAGLEALAPILPRLTRLRAIDLSRNRLNDGAAMERLLQAVRGHPALTAVDLSYNNITRESMPHLAELAWGVPSLQGIGTSGCALADSDRAEIDAVVAAREEILASGGALDLFDGGWCDPASVGASVYSAVGSTASGGGGGGGGGHGRPFLPPLRSNGSQAGTPTHRGESAPPGTTATTADGGAAPQPQPQPPYARRYVVPPPRRPSGGGVALPHISRGGSTNHRNSLASSNNSGAATSGRQQRGRGASQPRPPFRPSSQKPR